MTVCCKWQFVVHPGLPATFKPLSFRTRLHRVRNLLHHGWKRTSRFLSSFETTVCCKWQFVVCRGLPATFKPLSFRTQPHRVRNLLHYGGKRTSRFLSSFEMTVSCKWPFAVSDSLLFILEYRHNIQTLVISNPAAPGEKSASPQRKKNKKKQISLFVRNDSLL